MTQNKESTTSNMEKVSYCILCREKYLKKDVNTHMLSLLHHRELENIKGRDMLHWCNLCKVPSNGLEEYAKHIAEQSHRDRLRNPSPKAKPCLLRYYLDKKLMAMVSKRNRELKQINKKIKYKDRKKSLQMEAKLKPNPKKPIAHKMSNPKTKGDKPSKQVTVKGSKQAELETQEQQSEKQKRRKRKKKQPQEETPAWPPIGQLERNKENELARRSGMLAPSQPATPQCQSGAPDHESGPNTDQLGYAHYALRPTTFWPQNNELTRDDLPPNTATLFEKMESLPGSIHTPVSTSDPSSQEGGETGRIRSVDVTVMLRHVKRALRVNELPSVNQTPTQPRGGNMGAEGGLPTLTQNTQCGKSTSLLSTSSSLGDSSTRAVASARQSQILPKARESRNSQMTEEAVSRLGTLVPLGSLKMDANRHTSKLCTPKPNLTAARRIRKVEGEVGNKEGLKPELQKLLSSTGPQRKVSCKGIYQEANCKKLEKAKGMPRFGIELANPTSDPKSVVMGNKTNPAVPSSPIPQATPSYRITSKPPAGAPRQGPETSREPPAGAPEMASRDNGSSQTPQPVWVKMEWGLEPYGDASADGEQSESNKEKKRKRKKQKIDSELCQDWKKQKVTSNGDNVHVDQLLAVSLREEELCSSMETLDASLIQARNALQAAYAEVQRLLLVKQQVTAEISVLRARRIEILQGMQGAGAAMPTTSTQHTPPPPPIPAAPSSPFLSLTPIYPSTCSTLPGLNPAHVPPVVLPVKMEPVSNPALSISPVVFHQPANPVSITANPPAVVPTGHQKAMKSKLAEGPKKTQSKEAAKRATSAPDDQSSTASSTSNSEDEDNSRGRGDLSTGQDKRKLDKGTDDEDSDCYVNTSTVESPKRTKMAVVAIDDSDVEDEPEAPAQLPSTPLTAHKHVKVESSTQTTRLTEDSKDKLKLQNTNPIKINLPPDTVKVQRAPSKPGNQEQSVGSFEGHTGPVHDLQIHDGLLYTCSGDNTARAYCLVTRECMAVFEGHVNKINCLLVSSLPSMPARLFTGSSDQTIRCYSIKSRKCLEQISLPDRVLCLHIRWNILYVGIANGSVVSFDLKTQRQLDVFECHGPRGVSCMGTSQEGARRVLLVGSYDSTISVRDAKSGLLLRTLEGHTKTVLCMKVVNDLVFSGSSDTSVHAHNIHTGQLVSIYKGHGHAVTSLAILGKVMVTACLDKLVRVYELQSHDRLQVYGGHSEMVLCMVIHKSMIYTGCYDGTIKAVKLNLMQNYRCWWHGCSLIFGVGDHLLQHLLCDHGYPDGPNFTCRWKGCDTFIKARGKSHELHGHMQTHIEMDSKLEL